VNAERYYTIMLESARKRHREAIAGARPYRGFLREAAFAEAREWRAFAHNCVSIIRKSRQELRQ
jgi:CRISPR/Cas system endoribonuclease Cas6 (RAMP superfamily)